MNPQLGRSRNPAKLADAPADRPPSWPGNVAKAQAYFLQNFLFLGPLGPGLFDASVEVGPLALDQAIHRVRVVMADVAVDDVDGSGKVFASGSQILLKFFDAQGEDLNRIGHMDFVTYNFLAPGVLLNPGIQTAMPSTQPFEFPLQFADFPRPASVSFHGTFHLNNTDAVAHNILVSFKGAMVELLT